MEKHIFESINTAMEFLTQRFNAEIADCVSRQEAGVEVPVSNYDLVCWRNGPVRFGRANIEVHITRASLRNLAG